MAKMYKKEVNTLVERESLVVLSILIKVFSFCISLCL